MSGSRILCLGDGVGWHSQQLLDAAGRRGCELTYAPYESIAASIESGQSSLSCEGGRIDQFDAILTRTMPAGSLESVTFRLAVLHEIWDRGAGPAMVNPPRSLELAIDKFATLAKVQSLGYAVPETIVVQSRSEAMDAWKKLGGDCIVKPLFGGEGRGVMRVTERELAWTVFSTLERLDAVFYVQRFLPPGGHDWRMLVIGETVIGIRRENPSDFRANVAGGGLCRRIRIDPEQVSMAHRIMETLGLSFAAIDFVDDTSGAPKLIEVNAIPGWKGAQKVVEESIAERLVEHLESVVLPSKATDAVTQRASSEASCG